MTTTWIPLPGYPGYETNAKGQVRSWKVRGKAGAKASKPKTITPFFHHGAWWVRLNNGTSRANARVDDLVTFAKENLP